MICTVAACYCLWIPARPALQKKKKGRGPLHKVAKEFKKVRRSGAGRCCIRDGGGWNAACSFTCRLPRQQCGRRRPAEGRWAEQMGKREPLLQTDNSLRT